MKIYLYDPNQGESEIVWPVHRQTFYSNMTVGDYQFAYSPTGDEDYFISQVGTIVPKYINRFPKERRYCHIIESPLIQKPSDEFLSHFGFVISAFDFEPPKGTQLLKHHPAPPWMYGLKFRTDVGMTHFPCSEGYMELQDLAMASHPPKKTKLLSFVCSQKVLTAGQLWRVQVALKLKEYFKDEIDLFGFGWKPISDKREAVDDYKFSICIENTESDIWWTEKLADPILGYSIPIYSGANHSSQFFYADGLATLQFGLEPSECVHQIKSMIEKDYPESSLLANRSRLLFEHNYFYTIRNLLKTNG